MTITRTITRKIFQPATAQDGPSSSEIYGVAWDEVNDAYTRLGALAAYPLGSSPGNLALPIHRQCRRCVADDAGVVQYFLDPTDSTKKEDGTASDLTGTDGQVTWYVPKLYSRYDFSGGVHTWEMSQVSGGGFEIDPAFVKNGVEVDYRLIGAYEGYVDGGGKLCSVSGVLPTVSKTRAQFRTAAELRGTGWHQFDAVLHGLFARLMVIEYAELDSQTILGNGITDFATWPNAPTALTGNSNGIGDASGDVSGSVSKWAAATTYAVGTEIIPLATQNSRVYRCTVGGDSDAAEPTWPTVIGNTVVDNAVTWECVNTNKYVSYRGLEHPWGHIYKFVDGINIHNSTANRSRIYVCQNPTDFADDTDTGYTLAGLAPETDDYGAQLIASDAIMFPKAVGATTATGLADYYSTYFDNDPDVGWLVCLVGGHASSGANAGAFSWNSYNGSAFLITYIGGRLCR